MYTSECFITTTEDPKHKVNIRKWSGITGSWDYANAQFKSGVKVRLDPTNPKPISPGPHVIDGGISVANFYDVIGVDPEDGSLQGGYVAEQVLKPIECEKKLITQTDETKIPEYSDPSTNGNGNGNGGGGGGLALVGLLGITLLALDNK